MATTAPSLTSHEFVLEAMHDVLVPVLANSKKLLAELECRSSGRNQVGDAQQQVTSVDRAKEIVNTLKGLDLTYFNIFLSLLYDHDCMDLARALKIQEVTVRTLGSKTYRVRKADISYFCSNNSDEDSNSPNSLSETDVVAIWHNMECGLYYPLWSRPKGYFLIINIYTVKGQKSRLGTHWDAFRLTRIFKNLGLEPFKHIDEGKRSMFSNDLKANDILRAAKFFGNHEDHAATDCAVLAVLSHGNNKGILFGSDGKTISVDSLRHAFSPDPSFQNYLRGKPKILIVSACRGGLLGECATITPAPVKQILEKPEVQLNLVDQNFGFPFGKSAMDQVDGRRKLERPLSVADALTDRNIDNLNLRESANKCITRKRFLNSTIELSITSDKSKTSSEEKDHIRGAADVLEQLAVAMAYFDDTTFNKTEHAARAMAELAARSANRVDNKGTSERLEIDGKSNGEGDGPTSVRNSSAPQCTSASTGFRGTISFETSSTAHDAASASISISSPPPRSETPSVPAPSALHIPTSPSVPSVLQPTLSATTSTSGIFAGSSQSAIYNSLFPYNPIFWNAAATQSSTTSLTSPRWPKQAAFESSAQTREAEAESEPPSLTKEMSDKLKTISRQRIEKPVSFLTTKDEPVHVHVDSDLIELYSTTPERESNRNRYTGTWFIQDLCNVLEDPKLLATESLARLFIRANQFLSKREFMLSRDGLPPQTIKQVAQINSSQVRELLFFPGIHPDICPECPELFAKRAH